MKEIRITLNVTGETEKELHSALKDFTFRQETTKEWETIHRGEPVFRCFEYPISYGIFKDEYTTLKEKCIELECKRIGVDKLDEYQVYQLGIIVGFGNINIAQNKEEEDNIQLFTISSMKSYIAKVEKELKDKEFKNQIISGNNMTVTYTYTNNSGEVVYKYFGGINPVETKIKVEERLALKDKLEYLYLNDKLTSVKRMTKDEIFNKYQDILTKEQIKELYKNKVIWIIIVYHML